MIVPGSVSAPWLNTGFSAAAPPYVPAYDGASFDGSSYQLRGGDFSGNADGPNGILSVWLEPTLTGNRTIIANESNFFVIMVNNASNKIGFDAFDSLAVSEFSCATDTAIPNDGLWHHLALSWDMNHLPGSRVFKAAIDGAASTITIGIDSGIGFSIDYTRSDWGLGATVATLNKYKGCMAEPYFNVAAFLDITTPTNNQLFRTAAGHPANLGATGSTPTGSQPIWYSSIPTTQAASNLATNLGSGGNMTITGAYTTCGNSP